MELSIIAFRSHRMKILKCSTSVVATWKKKITWNCRRLRHLFIEMCIEMSRRLFLELFNSFSLNASIFLYFIFGDLLFVYPLSPVAVAVAVSVSEPFRFLLTAALAQKQVCRLSLLNRAPFFSESSYLFVFCICFESHAGIGQLPSEQF